MRRRAGLLVLGLVASAAACSSAPAGTPRIDVVDARTPAPPSPDVGVSYFTVRNRGSTADRFLSATTDVAARAQIDQVLRHGRRITMAPAGPVDVPAHRSVVFVSGGSHLMLIGLQRALNVGDHFTVILHFQRSGDISVTVPVVPYSSA
jgi:copper(I)-binding protein